MTSYPLLSVLGLRKMREERAVRGLETARRQLVKAREHFRAARTAHQAYLEWLRQEEQRRYQKIMETLMSLAQVDDFKQGLLEIRGRESRYLDGILKAENTVQNREQEVVRAKSDLLTAQKGTMKIQAHRDLWDDAAKKETERLEELEMEDFTGPRADVLGMDFLGCNLSDEQEAGL